MPSVIYDTKIEGIYRKEKLISFSFVVDVKSRVSSTFILKDHGQNVQENIK